MWLGCNYVSKALSTKRKLYGILYHAHTNLDDWKHKPGRILHHVYVKNSREMLRSHVMDAQTTLGFQSGRCMLPKEKGHSETQ